MNDLLLSSPSFSLEPFGEMLDRIAQHYSGWEIVAEYKHSLPMIKKDFLALAPSYGLKFQVHAPLSDINISAPNESVRATAVREVTECVRTAAELGIMLVTIHPGLLSPLSMKNPDWCLKLCRESVMAIYKESQDCGIKLVLENMPKMSITTCQNIKDILRVIDGTEIGICFDFGHANTTGTIPEFLDRKDIIGNIHIHDNDGKWDQHLIPGTGNIDFNKYIPTLKGYTNAFVYESSNFENGINGKTAVERFIRLL